MKGLDLSKMKKVSSDDKTTVFRHDNGHEVKIAHAGLSPKLMAELKKIPMHAQKMAHGGEPDANAEPTPAPSENQDNPAPVAQAPAPQAPADNAPDQSAVPEDATAPAEPAQAVPQPAQPALPQPKTIGQILTEPTTADEALAHFNTESQKLRDDFANGKIEPKSYGDLFDKDIHGNDRGTLGKIGMLFGMLASGMGSGLSHQPNALLGMMDKEIERDVEAQRQNKQNKFSAANLAENHYRNEVQNHFTQQQGAQTEAQTALGKANADIAATKSTSDILDLRAKKYLMDKMGLVPANTPAGQKTQAAMGMVSNAIDQRMAARNQKAAQQIAANGQQYQQQQQQEAPSESALLSPKVTPQIMQGLMSPYNTTLSGDQKNDLNNQYKTIRQTEATIDQVKKLFPALRQRATRTDVYGKTLAGLPMGLGEGAQHLLDQSFGGNQQRQYKTDKDSMAGYITSLFTSLGMSPTEAASKASEFTPTYGDDDETYNNRLTRFVDKATSMARAKAPLMDSLGYLKKK